MAREQKRSGEFVTILSSDATFRLTVPEGTEGAEKREYETKDGTKGTKNEIVFKAISGKVTRVAFAETEFGKLLQLTVTDENGDLTISTNVNSSFAVDIMKKLPNMDFEKEYRFAPFSFTGDNGKNIRGVSISEGAEQNKDAVKVENFFYDKKAEKALHNFPEPKGDTTKFTSNKWKAYFGEVEDFLVDYTTENIIERKTGIDAFPDIDPEKEAEALMGKKK